MSASTLDQGAPAPAIMRKVYTAADPLQAHVLRGALEAVGIAAEVRGGFLFGARGETPITVDTAPSVWVPEDADPFAVQTIVRQFDAKPGANGPTATWRCECGEVSEIQFTECWNCGRTKASEV
jgi:hypothetical protein